MFAGGDYLLREETQEEFIKYKLNFCKIRNSFRNNGRDSEFLRPSPCPRQGSSGLFGYESYSAIHIYLYIYLPNNCLKHFEKLNKHEDGTKIKGLILGISAAVLILIGVTMYFYQRRKTRNQVQQTVNT